MGSIDKYIFRTTLASFALVLVSLTGVIWITQALRGIDLMTSQGQTILTFLGVTSLVPSEPQDDAVLFTAADNQYISVPNGADINTAGPYANKSFEFWFYANSLPSPSASGLAATAGPRAASQLQT